jgi:hypothetical protein
LKIICSCLMKMIKKYFVIFIKIQNSFV